MNPRKQQLKQAKKAAKRKEHNRALQVRTGQPLPSFAAKNLLNTPFYLCKVADVLWSEGIGSVVVIRRLLGGTYAMATFLVDIYCLGVKAVYFGTMDHADVLWRLDQIGGDNYTWSQVTPAYVRKLLDDVTAYAEDLGLSPTPDYKTAALILADVNPEGCTETFVFGKDGKPFYISGPRDTEARSQVIIETLHRRCGPDGYDYLMGFRS